MTICASYKPSPTRGSVQFNRILWRFVFDLRTEIQKTITQLLWSSQHVALPPPTGYSIFVIRSRYDFILFVLLSFISLTEEESLPERGNRLLSVFNVVTFPNSACGASSGYNGTCYTSSECTSKGGSASGNFWTFLTSEVQQSLRSRDRCLRKLHSS